MELGVGSTPPGKLCCHKWKYVKILFEIFAELPNGAAPIPRCLYVNKIYWTSCQKLPSTRKSLRHNMEESHKTGAVGLKTSQELRMHKVGQRSSIGRSYFFDWGGVHWTQLCSPQSKYTVPAKDICWSGSPLFRLLRKGTWLTSAV